VAGRIRILLAAVVMQMCLGATYSWAVYVQPLRALTGLLQGTVQLPFTVFYFVFPATMMGAGTLLPIMGPRRCALAGGLLFGGGWLLAGLGEGHFGLTVAGIGVLGGLGVGLAYIVPIATCIQWFPQRKGLVTGIAVAGFGGGAALVSKGAGLLMHGAGLSPFATFHVLGVVYALLVTLAGAQMRFPPGAAPRPSGGRALAAAAIVGEGRFWVLYLAMIGGLAAGFSVNANLRELFPGDSAAGVNAVAVFAAANALGRVAWGALFDRWRVAPALQCNLAAQALLLACAPLVLTSAAGLTFFAALAGFNYGGVLVLYAAAVARQWGAERVGQVYGWLFSANIPAAAAPMLAGYCYDRSGSFSGVLGAIALLMAGGALLIRWQRRLLQAGGTDPVV
jgi:OFA family oxalate/formate antiporter-like MFS transporter